MPNAQGVGGFGPVYKARNHSADIAMLSKLSHQEKQERLELAAHTAGVHRNPDYVCSVCGKSSHLAEVPF